MARSRRSKKQGDALSSLIVGLALITTIYGADWLHENYGIQQIWTGYGIMFVLSLIIAIVIFLIAREIFQLPGSTTYDRRMKSLKLANVDEMSGYDFEKYIALLMKHQGYKVKLTGRSGDLGVDVIAAKGDERLAIQCKRFSNKVPRNAVSDAVAGMAHYKCNKAMVVTTNYYQPGAKKLAKSNKVELIDREILSQWIDDFQKPKENI